MRWMLSFHRIVLDDWQLPLLADSAESLQRCIPTVDERLWICELGGRQPLWQSLEESSGREMRIVESLEPFEARQEAVAEPVLWL